MALIPIRVDRTTKPPLGTPLRSDGHWSVQGLVGVKPLHSTVDSVSGVFGVASGATHGVEGYHFANTGDKITWPTTARDSLSGNFSILFSVFVDSVPGSYQSIIARDDYDQRIVLRGMDYGSSQDVLCQFGATFVGAFPVLSDNRYKWLPLAYTSSSIAGQKAYAYGSLIGSDAYTSAIFTGSSTVLGDRGGLWPLHGTIAYVVLYNRTLDANQIASLSANPWQIYEPEVTWIEVGGGGGTQSLFDGSLTGQGSLSAQLTTEIRFASASFGSGSASANLTTQLRLAASVLASSSATGQLTNAIRFGGTLAGSSAITAALTNSIRLAAQSAGLGAITGQLAGTIAAALFAGSISGSAAPTGNISTSIVMAAAAAGNATAHAALTTALQLAAITVGTSNASATLTTAIALLGVAAGDGEATGDLYHILNRITQMLIEIKSGHGTISTRTGTITINTLH